MARGRVTADTVNALAPGERDQFLWDDKLAGFGVKVTPKGAKIYVLQYRMGGRGSPTQRYTIGKEGGGWRPQSARTEAERLARLVGQGEDIVKKKAEAVKAAEVATDLAFDKYLKRFAEGKLKAEWPKSWQRTKRRLELHAGAYWKDKPLPSITKADVRKLLERVDHSPATKRNLYAALSYLFNQAVKADDLAVSPMDGLDAPPPVADRGHTLDQDELRWLWLSTNDLPKPYGTIYRLLTLLGQRRSEVAEMDWRELNRTAGEWHIPADRAKNDTDTVVPLPSSAISMLDAIAGKKDKWPRQGLVFRSKAGTAPSGFSKVKRALDAKMAKVAKADGGTVRPWRNHDLRRTLATNQQRLGTPFEVVEHLLNHKERSRTGIGKVYQTHGFKAEKRMALERWEGELERIVSGAAATVVPFKAKESA